MVRKPKPSREEQSAHIARTFGDSAAVLEAMRKGVRDAIGTGLNAPRRESAAKSKVAAKRKRKSVSKR